MSEVWEGGSFGSNMRERLVVPSLRGVVVPAMLLRWHLLLRGVSGSGRGGTEAAKGGPHARVRVPIVHPFAAFAAKRRHLFCCQGVCGCELRQHSASRRCLPAYAALGHALYACRTAGYLLLYHSVVR